MLARAARSTPLGGGPPAGGWPRPLVLPRAAVSSHSSLEPSALNHGVGLGGGAVRRRSWSSENRAVRWSPSGCRAVTSRAPRRATLPDFLAWRGNGSSSPGREKGGREDVERGARACCRESRRARVALRERVVHCGTRHQRSEHPRAGCSTDGRSTDGRSRTGRAREERAPEGRPGAPERGDEGRAEGRPEEGRSGRPEEGRPADEGRAAPRDEPASSRSPRYAGRSRRRAPLVPDVRDVRAAGAPGRAECVGRPERSVRFTGAASRTRPFLGSSSSARQLPAARPETPLARDLGAPGFPELLLPPAEPDAPPRRRGATRWSGGISRHFGEFRRGRASTVRQPLDGSERKADETEAVESHAADERQSGERQKPPERTRGAFVLEIPAATYSPRGPPPKYHRAGGLNCRVRNGNGCFPAAMATGNRALDLVCGALKHGRRGQRIALPQPLSVPKRARASSQALGRLVPVG